MQSEPKILYWRRTDVPGLERLTLSVSADAVWAESTGARAAVSSAQRLGASRLG